MLQVGGQEDILLRQPVLIHCKTCGTERRTILREGEGERERKRERERERKRERQIKERE